MWAWVLVPLRLCQFSDSGVARICQRVANTREQSDRAGVSSSHSREMFEISCIQMAFLGTLQDVGYVKWHINPLLPRFCFLLLLSMANHWGWGHGPLYPLSYASDSGVARICQRGSKWGSKATERGAKLFFPPQFRTPSTNSFAYSQSETTPPPPWTYDMNIHDLRLRNKSTHVRGLVILRKRGSTCVHTQDAYNQIYVQWMATWNCHTSCYAG